MKLTRADALAFALGLLMALTTVRVRQAFGLKDPYEVAFVFAFMVGISFEILEWCMNEAPETNFRRLASAAAGGFLVLTINGATA
jgi:hypothetical protein